MPYECVLFFLERCISYGKFPASPSQSSTLVEDTVFVDLPTLELASVRLSVTTRDQKITWDIRMGGYLPYLFKVVDLPDDGFPTRPMSGSRGIVLFKKPLWFTSSVLRCLVGIRRAGPRVNKIYALSFQSLSQHREHYISAK